MKNECFIGEENEKGEFYTKKSRMKMENSIGDKVVQKNEKGVFCRQ